jgi:RNA polymerase sigma-70 factor (ECF subfamily)
VSTGVPAEDEAALVAAVVAGDKVALTRLVRREHGWLVRLARSIVKDAATADEVVQDGWVAVIRALPTFEGRSSLRTWMASIVLNRAKTVAVRSARVVAISSFAREAEDEADGDRYGDHGFGALGFWSSGGPGAWHSGNPEELLSRGQLRKAIDACIEALPPAQRTVVNLRDVEGWSSEEVCNALGLSESNQRVLLHRARCKLRVALEGLLGSEGEVGIGAVKKDGGSTAGGANP